jgi:hypothetical protein
MTSIEEMTLELVAMAEANEARMDGTTDPVKRIIAEHDVVFGIWPEESGYGTHIIKGCQLLEEIHVSGISRGSKVTAVFVACEEMAIAAEQTLGEKTN